MNKAGGEDSAGGEHNQRAEDGRLGARLTAAAASAHSLPRRVPSPPASHLLLCFCSLYFWRCFPFAFPIESLWKNSTLVSVGPGKRGTVHSSQPGRPRGARVLERPGVKLRAVRREAWGGHVTRGPEWGPAGPEPAERAVCFSTLSPELPSSFLVLCSDWRAELRPPPTAGNPVNQFLFPYPGAPPGWNPSVGSEHV